MIWAIIDNRRVMATPRKEAICPLCGKEVISKCGSINIWHWSHKNNIDCDNWSEGETWWHINWKDKFPKEQQEIVIKKCISDYCNDKKYHAPCSHIDCPDCEFVTHRADIKTKTGTIIELQSTSISPEKIQERENFYGDIIWLLNGKELCSGLELRQKEDNKITFRWKHPPKSWWSANKPIFIHLTDYNEDKIFLVKKVYYNIPCGGWGYLYSKKQFLEIYGNIF